MYKKIIVKVGSNVLTGANGLPDLARMEHISRELVKIRESGVELILVSSGAVAAGRGEIKPSSKADIIAVRQILAAVGQVKLMNIYSDIFQRLETKCAQVLVTKEDFRDRQHYLNMRNCFQALLQHNIIPIVNENDVISVTELMFTDNDELAGLIASMMGADAVVILTNVDGVFDGDPRSGDAKLIPIIDAQKVNFDAFVTPQRSNFGRGGMITKSKMAHKLAMMGITVHVANGKKDGILSSIFNKEAVGTKFIPQKNTSHLKRWIAHSEGYAKGYVVVNEGARQALLTQGKATSLLPVGIVNVEGHFEKGDIIKIFDEKKNLIAIGMAQFGSETVLKIIGQKNQKPIIHYDYLFLNPDL